MDCREGVEVGAPDRAINTLWTVVKWSGWALLTELSALCGLADESQLLSRLVVAGYRCNGIDLAAVRSALLAAGT